MENASTMLVSTGLPQVFKHHLLEVYNDAQHPPFFCALLNHNVTVNSSCLLAEIILKNHPCILTI